MILTKCSLPSKFITILWIFINLHGLTYSYDDQLENPPDDPRLSAPWVASIFKLNTDGKWKYHCGGTLTKSFVVITAASCVSSGIGDNNEILYHTNYTQLRVYVGLRYISKEYRPDSDQHTQFSEVSLIREHKPLQLSQNQNISVDFRIYESPANLAAILLSREFNFTAYIQPAYLAKHAISIWEANIIRGEVGTVAGFNENPLVESNHQFQLQMINLTTSISWDCSQRYQQHTSYYNIACGYFPGEATRNIPCFLEGAGLIGYIEESGYSGHSVPYLMSIYTSNSATLRTSKKRDPYPLTKVEKNTQCTQADMIYFTRLGEYFRWANSHSLCGANLNQCQGGGCYEPNKICDGFPDCADISDESKEVCKNQRTCDPVKEFRCDSGVCIPDEKFCDGKTDCVVDNSDESDEKKCLEKDFKRNIRCKPIPESEGVATKCTLPQHRGGSPINCIIKEVPALTTAQQSCKTYYTGQVQLVTCLRNGTWSNTFLKCVPDCGRSESTDPDSGIGKDGEWPWYTAIYKLNKTDKVKNFWCGGSLISTTVVLTAAHCVTEYKTKTLLNKEDLGILLGKLKKPYTENDNQDVQNKTIRNIIIHKDYGPLHYEADIALIILNEPVNLTRSVRPICLPQDESVATRQFVDEIGVVVGFGADPNKKDSTALKVVRLKYLDRKECAKDDKRGSLLSWICGRRKNDNSVCKGDSGGGFVFPSKEGYENQRYVIEGLVSHGLTEQQCSNDIPEVFTKLSLFVSWINRHIKDPEGPMLDEWYQIKLKANGLLTWSRDKVNNNESIYRVQIVYKGDLLQNYEKGSKYHDDSLWKFKKSEEDPKFYILENKNLPNAVLTWEVEEISATTTRKNVVLIDGKAKSEEYFPRGQKRNDILWQLEMEPPNPDSNSTYFKIYNRGFKDGGILTYFNDKEEAERKKGRHFLQIYSNQNVTKDREKDADDYTWSLTTADPDENVIPNTNLFIGIWYQIKLKNGGLLTRSFNKISNGGYHVQILRGDLPKDFRVGGKSYNDTLWMIMKSNRKEFYKLINHNLPNAATTFGGNSPNHGKWMVLIDGRANADEYKETSLWKINKGDDNYFNIINGHERTFKKNGVVTYSDDGEENYVQILRMGSFLDEWRHDPDYLWSFTDVSDSDIGQWQQNQIKKEAEANVRRIQQELRIFHGHTFNPLRRRPGQRF